MRAPAHHLRQFDENVIYVVRGAVTMKSEEESQCFPDMDSLVE